MLVIVPSHVKHSLTAGNANAKQPPISQCDRDRFVDVMSTRLL
jgi:hypothetical protein